MSVPSVLRGVTLLSTTVAALPIHRVDAQGRRVDLGWIEQPEAGRPRFATFNSLVQDLILDGKAYLYAPERDASGARSAAPSATSTCARLGTITKPDGSTGILIDGREVGARGTSSVSRGGATGSATTAPASSAPPSPSRPPPAATPAPPRPVRRPGEPVGIRPGRHRDRRPAGRLQGRPERTEGTAYLSKSVDLEDIRFRRRQMQPGGGPAASWGRRSRT